MKSTFILFAIVLLSVASCKNGTQPSQDPAPVSDNITDETANLPDPMCTEIQDMVAAMKAPQNYGEFHLYETVCHPNRTFGFHYESDDEAKNMEFTILIRDTRTPDNINFTNYINDGFAEAQASKTTNVRVSKLPYGTKGYVVALNGAGSYGGSYDVFLKENYYLHFLMVNNKNVATTDAIESFVAPLLAKINTSKLK